MKEETPKQKAIREAWESAGFVWDEIQHRLQKWDESIFHLEPISIKYTLTGYGEAQKNGLVKGVGVNGDKGLMVQLESLRGLNSNNGWIRTDEQLPEDGQECWAVLPGGVIDKRTFNAGLFSYAPWYWAEVTHWQPFRKPKPPIY